MRAAYEGIRTFYKGRWYRSRLEARWACFFNLVGWRYEYEPREFNGWIPDFLIIGVEPVYVEVKPICRIKDPLAVEAIKRIEASGVFEESKPDTKEPRPGAEVLILGMTCPIDAERLGINPVLGWTKDWGSWEFAVFGSWKDRSLGYCSSEGWYRDRISGEYHGGHIPWENEVNISELWQETGNKTQWRAAR